MAGIWTRIQYAPRSSIAWALIVLLPLVWWITGEWSPLP